MSEPSSCTFPTIEVVPVKVAWSCDRAGDRCDIWQIVGDDGAVVPTCSPAELASAIQLQIEKLPAHDPHRPRGRITENFSITAMVEGTLEVFRCTALRRSGRLPASQAELGERSSVLEIGGEALARPEAKGHD